MSLFCPSQLHLLSEPLCYFHHLTRKVLFPACIWKITCRLDICYHIIYSIWCNDFLPFFHHIVHICTPLFLCYENIFIGSTQTISVKLVFNIFHYMSHTPLESNPGLYSIHLYCNAPRSLRRRLVHRDSLCNQSGVILFHPISCATIDTWSGHPKLCNPTTQTGLNKTAHNLLEAATRQCRFKPC